MAANCLPSLPVGVGLDDVNDGESQKDLASAAVQEEEEEAMRETNQEQKRTMKSQLP